MGFFKSGQFNLGKRLALSCFGCGWRALVEILGSHLSAQDAERWGTRLLGWGEILWTGVLGDTGSLGCARDDRLFRVCTSEDARAYIGGSV